MKLRLQTSVKKLGKGAYAYNPNIEGQKQAVQGTG